MTPVPAGGAALNRTAQRGVFATGTRLELLWNENTGEWPVMHQHRGEYFAHHLFHVAEQYRPLTDSYLAAWQVSNAIVRGVEGGRLFGDLHGQLLEMISRQREEIVALQQVLGLRERAALPAATARVDSGAVADCVRTVAGQLLSSDADLRIDVGIDSDTGATRVELSFRNSPENRRAAREVVRRVANSVPALIAEGAVVTLAPRD